MRWLRVFYPELYEQDPTTPGHFLGKEDLYTDLECSTCGYHVYPPTYPDQCPRCGEERETHTC